MRAWLVVAWILAGCATTPVPATLEYRGLNFRYGVITVLQAIQEEFESEFVLCLLGEYRPDGVVNIDGIAPARLGDRSPGGVVIYGCDDPGVVGLYHNHVPQEWDNCHFSPKDVTALENYYQQVHTLVLSCKGGIVFRFRGESGEHYIAMPASRTLNQHP